MSVDFERTLSRGRSLMRENSMSMAAVSFEESDDEEEDSPAVSVPFMWESQPGTPKAEYRRATPPAAPLTPPPSYYSPSSNLTKVSPKPANLLKVLFSKRSSRKTRHRPLSPDSSLSHSSSPAPSAKPGLPRRDAKVKQMKKQKEEEEEDDDDDVSPIATACLGRPNAINVSSKGCYSFVVRILFWDFR